MRVLLKSAKLVAVLLSLSWAGVAIYLGSISNYARLLVEDAVVVVSSPVSKSAAVYMVIHNNTDSNDRLIQVRTDIARIAGLHTEIIEPNGTTKLQVLPSGISVLSGDQAELKRGGDRILLKGLKHYLAQGESVTMILNFEKAGELVISVPVEIKT
jgi:copper(I)-binding protein